MPTLLDIQPGWALLLGGLVLLIAGLVLLWLSRAQTSSDTIQHSLTLRPTSSLFTFTPLLLDDSLLMATQSVFVPDLPRCYDTPTADLLCLGQLKNTTDKLWKNISLTIWLQNQFQQITLEQSYLLPHQTAPYRVIWSSPGVREEDAVLSVLPPQLRVGSEDIFVIPIQDVAGLWLDQRRYRVRGMLQNPYDVLFKQGQIVVTLLDSEGAVVAYRLRDLPLLMSDAHIPFLMDLTPIVYEETLIPQITVLAWTH